MKRYLSTIGILLVIAFLAVQTQAGPPITQGLKTNATGALDVTAGGTGRATGTSAYGLITTGTTATGAQQTVTAGATTTILVGGGAAAIPVWTTATGSGAPVRATQPTLATPTISDPIITAAYVSAGSEKMTGGTTWTGAVTATPPTGWTVVNAGLFDIVDSGDGVPYDIALRISVNAVPTASPAITIPITTLLGHGYQVGYAFKKGTAVSGTVKVGSTSGGTEYYTSGAITDAAWATRHVNFIAAGTTVYVTLMNNSGTAGETALFDTVQFTENPLTIAGIVAIGETTAPATSPANITQLWAADTGGLSANNSLHMRNEYGSTGPVGFAVPPERSLASANAITLGIPDVIGTMINNYGQIALNDNITYTLPAAAANYAFTFIAGETVAKFVRFDANAADFIYLDGVVGDGTGEYIGVASVAIGNSISCRTAITAAANYDWFCLTIAGGWVKE